MPDTLSHELAARIIMVPAYTTEDLGADELVEYGSNKERTASRVILINEKHRWLIAEALLAYEEK